MIKLPTRIWSNFSTILGLAGTTSLDGMQTEVVPVQDLTRVMQSDRVQTVAYSFQNTPAATSTFTRDWNDASDWTEVRVNGIITTNDADLPPLDWDRWVIAVGLAIGGTQAHYTSSEQFRLVPFTLNNEVELASYGDLVAGHTNAPALAPNLLPQKLLPQELTVRLTAVVSGNAAAFRETIQLVAAEPGVLAAYIGL